MDKKPISFLDSEKDTICELCPQRIIKTKIKISKDVSKEIKIRCPGNCLLQHWIGKLNIQIEPLLRDCKDNQTIMEKNYNQDLAELISDQQEKIDRALQINDEKKRAIAVLLLAGFKQTQLKTLFSMSYRQINRLVNNRN
jgi:hypothetical protein